MLLAGKLELRGGWVLPVRSQRGRCSLSHLESVPSRSLRRRWTVPGEVSIDHCEGDVGAIITDLLNLRKMTVKIRNDWVGYCILHVRSLSSLDVRHTSNKLSVLIPLIRNRNITSRIRKYQDVLRQITTAFG